MGNKHSRINAFAFYRHGGELPLKDIVTATTYDDFGNQTTHTYAEKYKDTDPALTSMAEKYAYVFFSGGESDSIKIAQFDVYEHPMGRQDVMQLRDRRYPQWTIAVKHLFLGGLVHRNTAIVFIKEK